MKRKKRPIFSIVTICFNEEDGIEKTCRSVVSQSSKDFEWIVIDGGSKDKTLEILKEYRKNMSFFISEKDSGVYNAMNKGITKSHGEFLIFLNGGDYLKGKEVLIRAGNFIKKDKKSADIYYGNLEYDSGDIVDFSRAQLDKRFFISKTISHQATFIKKNLFKKFGRYDETYKISADFDFWVKTIILGKVKTKYLPLVVSVFDQEGISTDPKLSRKQIEERNSVLLNYWLVNKRQVMVAKMNWTFLRILKKLRVYRPFRRIYRAVVKR